MEKKSLPVIIVQLVWHVLYENMEFIIKDKVLSFMINNNLLANLQYGVVPGKSCWSNLLSMFNILTDPIEHNLEVGLVHLDFTKVFDLVPHRKQFIYS